MKKIFILFIVAFCFFTLNNNVNAQEKVTIELFYGDWCPHCANEKEFLKEMLDKYDYLEVNYHEVWHNEENSKLMKQVATKFGDTVNGVPYTVIGDKTFLGYSSSIATKMEDAIVDNHNTSNDSVITTGNNTLISTNTNIQNDFISYLNRIFTSIIKLLFGL